jgi:hypothetical protein
MRLDLHWLIGTPALSRNLNSLGQESAPAARRSYAVKAVVRTPCRSYRSV